MGLEEEIKLLLRQRQAGIPWILEVSTGQKDRESVGDLTDFDFIKGLQIQNAALKDAVLILARAIDELSQDESP
jgi:hypothetical protein